MLGGVRSTVRDSVCVGCVVVIGDVGRPVDDQVIIGISTPCAAKFPRLRRDVRAPAYPAVLGTAASANRGARSGGKDPTKWDQGGALRLDRRHDFVIVNLQVVGEITRLLQKRPQRCRSRLHVEMPFGRQITRPPPYAAQHMFLSTSRFVQIHLPVHVIAGEDVFFGRDYSLRLNMTRPSTMVKVLIKRSRSNTLYVTPVYKESRSK